MFYLALFDNVQSFFIQGGVFMAVLLICSVVAFTVIILRSLGLRRKAVIPELIEKEIKTWKSGTSLEHLRRLVQEYSEAALSKIVEPVVQPMIGTKHETMEVVQSKARQQVAKMESGLFILEIIVGIAPLLGLLGAVSGLVKVFGNIGSGAVTTADLKGIALGIGEAFSTTIVGLAIAIVALIFFTYFSRRVERLAIEMEASMMDLMEKLYRTATTTTNSPGTSRERSDRNADRGTDRGRDRDNWEEIA